MFWNLRHAGSVSPCTLIDASSAWNSGLLIASATNSSKFLEPRAELRESFTLLNNVLSCFVVG